GGVTLRPESMRDFRPQGAVNRSPYLRSLVDALAFVDKAGAEGIGEKEVSQQIKARWPELPLDLSIPARDAPRQEERSKVDDILSMVAMPEGAGATPGAAAGKGLREQIRSLLARVLAEVYADEAFRTMEAAWRGVEILVRQGPVKDRERLIVQILPVGREGLPEMLEEISSQFSENPPNLILLDQAFDNTPYSIEVLEKVVDLAGTLLAPTAVWIGPSFFHLQTWPELSRLPYLKHHLEESAFAKWRKLGEQPGSEWLAVTVNRFLVREPYGDANPARPVPFSEREPLWISPVWALGTLVAQSIAGFGWPSRFTDYRRISLNDLAVGSFGGEYPSATETVFTEERIMQFLEAGITPLVGAIRRDVAFMPKESTLPGGSLKFQLFFNRIVGHLFSLKDAMGEAAMQADVGSWLEEALAELFRDTGHEAPSDISIQAGAAVEGETIPLRIAFTPPETVLPISERLEFSLAW
ncbi:MAG: type VI secretion system contractile sheath large subunit, partial [Deltaproteobacteria bacterium]|nr:type VI secretion system contractile sheath large subunit [Deltaproteobacteria bacterium]